MWHVKRFFYQVSRASSKCKWQVASGSSGVGPQQVIDISVKEPKIRLFFGLSDAILRVK